MWLNSSSESDCKTNVASYPVLYTPQRIQVYMADGQRNKLRYNAFQRRTESRLRRNQKVLLKEKQKPENSLVLDHERRLSTFNAKTVDFDKFKAYLRAKTLADEKLRPFYHRELHRKLKWRQVQYCWVFLFFSKRIMHVGNSSVLLIIIMDTCLPHSLFTQEKAKIDF